MTEPPPDPIGISTVSTRSFEGMRVEAYFDGQPSLMFDEPEGFDIVEGPAPPLNGRSRGWTPVHAQLAALAACTSITVTVVARDQGLAYAGLRTEITSHIDIRGFFFDLDRQPEYQLIAFDLWLDTAAGDAAITALAHEADRRCPQLGLFHKAGIPMVTRWFREGVTAPVAALRYPA